MLTQPSSRRSFLRGAALCPFALRSLFAQLTPTTVSTPDGRLRGELSPDRIRIFRGIPFAQPPTGPLRFRPPVAPKPWTITRDALTFAAPAIQPSHLDASEDCLYLNLWAPESKGPHPVFVWIHGGGFTGGTSFDPLTDGAAFARDGIVCITVAYRLGVFGFLDLSPMLGSTYAGSANNGLRDLVAALQWVQRNVASFGGDPTRVTIGGESAGAKLTGLLMGTPSAQPLFHQMISESGGAERVYAREASLKVAQGFADLYKRSNIATADPTTILEAQNQLMKQWPQHFPLRAQLDGTFLPQLPIPTIAAGSTRGKRLLLGTNREESASFIGPHPAQDPTAADLGNLPLARFNAVFPHYAALYPDLTEEQRRIRATTAEEYWVPSLRLAEAHVQGGGTAYAYELTLTEPTGRLKDYAYHGLDTGLVWNKPHLPAEASLATTLHAAWTAFIQGATPAAPTLPTWPAYDPMTRPTMIVNTLSKVENAPQQAELQLWTGVL